MHRYLPLWLLPRPLLVSRFRINFLRLRQARCWILCVTNSDRVIFSNYRCESVIRWTPTVPRAPRRYLGLMLPTHRSIPSSPLSQLISLCFNLSPHHPAMRLLPPLLELEVNAT